MTGFDPTTPERDTDRDQPDEFPDNVVPPEALTDEDEPPRRADTDAAGDDE